LARFGRIELAGPILALDVGEVRIGLAAWDEARGVRDEGYLRRGSSAEDIRRLARIVVERGATTVVVGLPRNLDGSEGKQAKRARRFARTLALSVTVPVVPHDEYETSIEATAELGLGGRPLSERERGFVDSRAAAITLRRYLGTLERTGSEPEAR
jgi:putative holliday junction resolvase